MTRIITVLLVLLLSFPLTAQQRLSKAVNLSGKTKELVIIMGFPDRDQSYPVLKNSSPDFPLLGVFPDGTLLSDYINSHGGSIPADVWYKPALNRFYSVYSGGMYDVNFDFIKRPDGKMYITKDNIQKWISKAKSADDIIWNNWKEMVSQVAEEIYKDYPDTFNDVTAIHFVFSGMNKNEFNTAHGGTVQWDVVIKGPSSGKIFFHGPISIQRDINAIAHERMHIIGKLAGAPKGFNGFPDRGYDVEAGEGHCNLLYGYDMMYHNASIVSQHSLYGYPPIISHDLIFLGWIKPEEILTIDAKNFSSYGAIKLADVNYPLSEEKLKQGFKRIVKVMIKENYSGNLDEYFLIEFHNASEFDKNFSNYDEFPKWGYNKGILIWHIKEKTDLINTFSDDIIDLITAVPYNGFYGKPLPDDDYPRGDYKRPENWNGNYSGENDYLDDDKQENLGGNHWVFKYLPDGGRSIWEISTKGSDWGWYPADKKRFPRLESLRSDFFSDEEVKGHVSNRFTDATHPSSMSWGGQYGSGTAGIEKAEKTHIAVTNIKHEKDYMTVNVFYNYWEGELKENSKIEGKAIIGSNLTVPENLSLEIKPGASIRFLNNAKIILKGMLNAKGTSKKNIVFDSGRKGSTIDKVVERSKSAKAVVMHVKVK